MYIAKMHTRYPDFKGHGYYNFLVESDEDILNELLEEYSHDYQLIKIVETRHKSTKALMRQYPTKEKLNDKYFKET